MVKELTERQFKLLRAATHHTIMESNGQYYRVGGHGNIAIRYHGGSYSALERLGLVEHIDGGWVTTASGRAAQGLK